MGHAFQTHESVGAIPTQITIFVKANFPMLSCKACLPSHELGFSLRTLCPLQVFSCSTETPHTVASSSIFVYLMQFVQKTVQTGEVSISFPCPSGPPRNLCTHTYLEP